MNPAGMKHRFLAASLCILATLSTFPSSRALAADDTDKPKPSRSMTGPEARNNNPEGEGLSKSAPSRLGKADRAFMTKAAGNGLYEIAAAKLAAERASDPAIKSLAAMLVREHVEAQQKLKKVALDHNYPLPDQLPEDKRGDMARLTAMSGRAFDRAFLDEIGVAAHQADIKMFERAARSTRTPDLKDWIEATLPKLKAHLADALKLRAK